MSDQISDNDRLRLAAVEDIDAEISSIEKRMQTDRNAYFADEMTQTWLRRLYELREIKPQVSAGREEKP